MVEEKIPLIFLGIDPLIMANEGKFVTFAPAHCAENILSILRDHPLGSSAAQIGMVSEGECLVSLRTKIGGSRILDMPRGEQLPRIC